MNPFTKEDKLSSNKVWDGVALLIGFLLSLVLIATLTQLVFGGEILDTFSNLTLRLINILLGVSIVLMILILVLENGSPATTLAWIMVLIFLPVVGFVFYLLFGRNWRKRRVFGKKSLVDAEIITSSHVPRYVDFKWKDDNALIHKLNRLLKNNSRAHLTLHNKVQLYAQTNEAFTDMLSSVSQARQHIHLEYFSIAADDTGKALQQLLIQKALSGVEVRFIYDAVGCWNLPGRFKKDMLKAGIQFVPFMPVLIPFLNSRMNYRNHRKLLIVDSRKAYLGGLNIGDKYLGKSSYYGSWRDSLAVIEGEGVISLQAIFIADWFFVSKENLLTDNRYLSLMPDNFQALIPLQIAASGPDNRQANILQLYFTAIAAAQISIRISTPYLILNESLRMALITAAISGVKVQIILPCKPDHYIVYWASRSYFKDLLDVGVEIWEYQNGFYHAKIMIVD